MIKIPVGYNLKSKYWLTLDEKTRLKDLRELVELTKDLPEDTDFEVVNGDDFSFVLRFNDERQV
ncbi:hypothetical protein HWB76_gp009 [Streptomyces phage Blueeyedbeauty]|uniref:Uncharacterized protein n=1 Tax=Streptomyces phage Blueeyedbeauty TaxID=2250336 RepID=A0A345L1K5_9CAUD|nr:hypothetical protein HWB76_gp009 [Streptomyces phage Blueeyedbeauty]AXH49157.1 hypothetical protein SEA_BLUEEYEDBEAUTY_9 [Streptomyces phage Blueeyedbeauty]